MVPPIITRGRPPQVMPQNAFLPSMRPLTIHQDSGNLKNLYRTLLWLIVRTAPLCEASFTY